MTSKSGSKLDKMVHEILNEITYRQFTKEAKSRNSKEAVHKALKEIKKRLKEVDRLVEFTTKMKNELLEAGNDIQWRHSEKNVQQINEAIKQIYKKSKNLYQ